MELIIDRSSRGGLYYYKGRGFRGYTAADLIIWVQESATNCVCGSITFTITAHGFEMEKVTVSYDDHKLKEDVFDDLKRLRVVAVKGYGGYGSMSLDVEITTYAGYLMYYEELPEPSTPWDSQ